LDDDFVFSGCVTFCFGLAFGFFLGFCVVVLMVDLRQSSHVLTRCCLSTSPRSQWICNCANESNAMTLWSLNISYQATSVLDQGSDDTSMGCFCMDPGNNDLTYALLGRLFRGKISTGLPRRSALMSHRTWGLGNAAYVSPNLHKPRSNADFASNETAAMTPLSLPHTCSELQLPLLATQQQKSV
jgi:hypothetical protein